SSSRTPMSRTHRRPSPTLFPYTTLFRSIGRAAAKRLGQEGGKIVVADRVEPAAEQTVGELRQHGVDAASAIVDLGAFEGAQKLIDRKSTRLNSSHVSISYAVFCLKKKKR